MLLRILRNIILRQPKQRRRRFQSILLQMNERSRQLNHPLIEQIIALPPLSQPKFLQYIVSLIKKLLIETLKISQVMGIHIPSLQIFDHRGDPRALLAHAPNVLHRAAAG